MVNKTKVLNGPFSLDFLDSGDTTVLTSPITGRLKDAISLSTENLSEDLEDGSKDVYAQKLLAEITLSELDTAAMDEMEGNDVVTVVITFTAKAKKLTISDPNTINTFLDNLKTKIVIEKINYDAGRPYTVTDVT